MATTLCIQKNQAYRTLINKLTRADSSRKLFYRRERREDFLVTFNGCCAWCGAPIPLNKVHFDHLIVPKRGGTWEKNNLVPSCAPCNDHRRDIDWGDWLLRYKSIPSHSIILSRAKSYVPLDLVDLRKSKDPKVVEAFSWYSSRCIFLEKKYALKKLSSSLTP